MIWLVIAFLVVLIVTIMVWAINDQTESQLTLRKIENREVRENFIRSCPIIKMSVPDARDPLWEMVLNIIKKGHLFDEGPQANIEYIKMVNPGLDRRPIPGTYINIPEVTSKEMRRRLRDILRNQRN